MAQNNGVTPAVEDVRSKLIAAVEKKKKENKIVPLLESLFEFHIDASLLDALISRMLLSLLISGLFPA